MLVYWPNRIIIRLCCVFFLKGESFYELYSASSGVGCVLFSKGKSFLGGRMSFFAGIIKKKL